MSISPYKVTLGTSIGVTTMLGLFSLMPSVIATTSSSYKNAVVTVGASCSMDSTVSSAHTATIAPGGYNKEIGLTNVAITCNDNGGYAIYAIGFGDDTLGNNVLHSTTAGTTDINTGNDFANATSSYSSNTSQWAMQVNNVSGSSIPTIVNNFDSLSLVPTTYTKVAEYAPTTTFTTTSAITTKYGAYIAIGHPAGTYTGKVKYTLVHPSEAPAPVVPPTPPTSCNTPVPDVTYMQEITSANKATILAQLTEDGAYYLRDSRDEEPYCVSKLKGGNLWMLDNLRLDLSDPAVLTNTLESNTNASATALGYLKNGGGTASDQYPTDKINSEALASNKNYYSIPVAVSSGNCSNTNNCVNNPSEGTWNKNATATSFGKGSSKVGVYYNYCAASAGTYCWGNGTSSGNSPYDDPKPNTGYDIDGDICPKGWRIPTGGAIDAGAIASGGYQSLYEAYNSNATDFMNALSTPLSGDLSYGKALQEYYGYSWSSTFFYNFIMYGLSWDSSSANPLDDTSSFQRSFGNTVRCVLGP